MKRNVKCIRRFTGSLCVFLLLICTFFILLPHPHQCGEPDCPVCAMLSAWDHLWLFVTATVSVVAASLIFGRTTLPVHFPEKTSLVCLKVELLD